MYMYIPLLDVKRKNKWKEWRLQKDIP